MEHEIIMLGFGLIIGASLKGAFEMKTITVVLFGLIAIVGGILL